MIQRRILRLCRRSWSNVVIFLSAFFLTLGVSLFAYDWRPFLSLREVPPPSSTPTPGPAATKPSKSTITNFADILAETLRDQFALYSTSCSNSDWIRPLTNECRNYTFATETALSALAAFHLVNQTTLPIFDTVPTLSERVGAEVGRVADYVIAPLISAHIVTQSPKYLEMAKKIGEDLLSFCNKSLFRPFIGVDVGQFGTRDVFMDSISSIYPVLASLHDLTRDKKFIGPIKKFLSIMNKSVKKNQIPNKYSLKGDQAGQHSAVLDIPWRIYSDIARIRKILPKAKTEPLLNLVLPFLNEANPIKVYDVEDVFVFSIQPCSTGAYLPPDHKILPKLLKKCGNLVRRNPLPSRSNGASEFGTYDLETGFAFEGELIELFWRHGDVEKAKKIIIDSLPVCRFGRAITGMSNATTDGRMSDNFLHPELFSRWIFNGALMELGVDFDDVVLSEGGHILKAGKETRDLFK
jgi:hypothetical protein